MLELIEDVRQAGPFLGRRRVSETGAEAFLLLQFPVDDDGVDQIFGLGGERLDQEVAESAGVDDGPFVRRLAASDKLEDRGTLRISQFLTK